MKTAPLCRDGAGGDIEFADAGGGGVGALYLSGEGRGADLCSDGQGGADQRYVAVQWRGGYVDVERHRVCEPGFSARVDATGVQAIAGGQLAALHMGAAEG